MPQQQYNYSNLYGLLVSVKKQEQEYSGKFFMYTKMNEIKSCTQKCETSCCKSIFFSHKTANCNNIYRWWNTRGDMTATRWMWRAARSPSPTRANLARSKLRSMSELITHHLFAVVTCFIFVQFEFFFSEFSLICCC